MGPMGPVKKKKITLVHIKTMQVSRAGIVQTERLEMPLLRLVWIIATCNMSTLEANAHFIDVYILRAS